MRRLIAATVVMAAQALAAAAETPWHDSLCLGRGGYWQKRIPVRIANPRGEAVEGEQVELAVGKAPPQADLAGADIRELRLCKADGTELLYRVIGPDRKELKDGAIPPAGRLVLPVEAAARSETTYYLYFANPQAWATPDLLKPARGGPRPASKPAPLGVSAGAVESLSLKPAGAGEAWADPARWPIRQQILLPCSNGQDRDCLVQVDVTALVRQARRQGLAADATPDIRLSDGARDLNCCVRDDRLYAAVRLPARSLLRLYAYAAPRPAEASQDTYAALTASAVNLLRNSSFEAAVQKEGTSLPAEWQAPTGPGQGSIMDGGKVAAKAARLQVASNDKKQWTGWIQGVTAEPNTTYLYAAWVRCRDVSGKVSLHAHAADAKGKIVQGGFLGSGRPVGGTADWTLLAGSLRTPPGTQRITCHLTMNAAGTVDYDGAILAPLHTASPGELETRSTAGGVSVWPVNAVVKVFREDAPPKTTPKPHGGLEGAAGAVVLSAARNEREPLQLAVRSDRDIRNVRVQVVRPKSAVEARLDCSVAVVGYVPIDYPTNYYQSRQPAWHRMRPTRSPGCDGWAGWWPDPLLPRDTFDLKANQTQPIWITVSVPADAERGNYMGWVSLTAEGKPLADLPFTVRVWDFALPEVSRCKAIYDVRVNHPLWKPPGSDEKETWKQLVRFMAERRLCPDTVFPRPKIDYRDGKVVADFADFDKAAEYYFDELKLPHAYTPWPFYLFGWGMPPRDKFAQKAYEGDWPFDGVDRSKLRPEFKRVYQACLRAYWEHMKAKGWHKRVIFYISDEPFYTKPHIIEQMKALCDMVHEVDREIPIYSSTWHHVPQWDNSLDVWGIGIHGVVPVEQINKLRQAGKRFLWTTDGHMCTDTPYCAVERLLPHFCFQYGAEGYEFWGITWLTYDPYRFGWHAFISQSDTPTNHYHVRYPNGDGFLIYPGGPVGVAGPVSSVRLEQAREGVEDYEYLATLAQRVQAWKAVDAAARFTAQQARERRKLLEQAEAALKQASELVSIPNSGGRYSTKLLPDPDAVFRVKQALGEAIEALGTK